MAIAASPAPRKTAFSRNRSMIVAFPPASTRVYPVPPLTTSGCAPRSSRSCGAYTTPITPMTADRTTPTAIACTAERAAPSGSPLPIRRATIAVTPIERPIATVYTSVTSDSARPTAVIASGPRRETQNTSVSANTDSSAVSITMGIASRSRARPTGPRV